MIDKIITYQNFKNSYSEEERKLLLEELMLECDQKLIKVNKLQLKVNLNTEKLEN